MIKVENIETWGFEHAIRGMRNPMNSWDKSDSWDKKDFRNMQDFDEEKYFGKTVPENCTWDDGYKNKCNFVIGKKYDLALAQRLFRAGSPHRKYLRQIFVSMDITAPLYWWKEFDTYKVGTTANSCSTMHKIHAKEFTLDDFSHEHLLYTGEGDNPIDMIMHWLNYYRKRYLETKDKDYWWQMIQLLPTSYNQKRTVTFTYETVFNMLEWRQNHKLDEWCEFCEILKDLPYVREIGDMYEDITE